MLLMFSFLILLIQPISCQEVLKYTVKEKSPINTLIADLSHEIQINRSASYSLFELLPINKKLVSIHHQTGYLTTLSILDREYMCLKQQCSCHSCKISFHLTIDVHTTIIYKIIEIRIEDLNDHSPIFDDVLMTRIIHIRENVPLGYRIVLPIAQDPDEGNY